MALRELEKTKKKRIAAAKKKQRLERQQARRKKKEFYDNDRETRREKAVEAFNAFIRWRDRGRNCISCGKSSVGVGAGRFDAGHYIPAGSCSALRFNEFNVNLQCHWNCNIHQSGNRTNYRKGLILRYGSAVVDFLEGPQPTVKITPEWYRGIEDTYKKKLKQLKEQSVNMEEEF